MTSNVISDMATFSKHNISKCNTKERGTCEALQLEGRPTSRQSFCMGFNYEAHIQPHNAPSIYILPLIFFAIRPLISETIQQRPSKVYQWLGPRCRTKIPLKHFANHSPFLQKSKVRNLVSIFDTSRIWSALVLKRRNVSLIFIKVQSSMMAH